MKTFWGVRGRYSLTHSCRALISVKLVVEDANLLVLLLLLRLVLKIAFMTG